MPTLDFLVIGAQKAGTTTLHVLLKQHPDLWLPPEKETPYFTDNRSWSNFSDFLEDVYGHAPTGMQWGGVNPQYMRGEPELPVSTIAERVFATLPKVKLIAVLRDPIERAISEWRMAIRRGQEHRTFERAVNELLQADALRKARSSPSPTTSYLVQGEYGRILSSWCQHFPRESLHVIMFDDLCTQSQKTMHGLQRFLGVPVHAIKPVAPLHRSGSRTRVSLEQVQELRRILDQHVWPSATPRTERAFNYWFGMWNIIEDDVRPPTSPSTLDGLRDLFAADASALRRLGIEPRWLS